MEKKMTKKEMYATLLTIEEVLKNEELVNALNHEIDLLNKPRKRTASSAKQIENQKLRDLIVQILGEEGEAMSIKMLKEVSEELQDLSSQKLAAILRPAVEEGILKKEVVKKVTYYELVKD